MGGKNPTAEKPNAVTQRQKDVDSTGAGNAI